MRIVATMVNGTKHEAEGDLLFCTADRIAFRERFGLSYSGFLNRNNAFRDGEGEDDWDERWLAFFDWCCLSRGGLSLNFEDFCAQVAAIHRIGDDEYEDPTDLTPTTSSSPSSSSSPESEPGS